MTSLVIFYIFMWSSILALCVTSALAGAKDRIRQDEKYSFRKLYEGRDLLLV
jgi:hypothetical protein